jgi:hypothetical protein
MQDVSEVTKYRVSFINNIKLKLYKIFNPVLTKLGRFKPFFTFESFLIYYFFLVILFGRSFTGVKLISFRVGELMIATAMFLLFYFIIFRSKSIDSLVGSYANLTIKFILINFFIVNFINGGINNFTNPQVFRSSSYIWSLGFLFVLSFLRKFKIFDSNIFLLGIIIVLPLTYVLTSVNFPAFLSDFFNQYSDKFRLLKGSDLFLGYAIYCLLFFERIKSNNFIYFFTFAISGLLIPLIVFSSRGASIGCFILLIFCIFKYRKSFLRNKLLFLISLPSFVVPLTLSSVYLDWTEIDFQKINTEVAVESLEMTLVSKRYPEVQKPYFYFEDSRINSGDGNLNWRLQIWQDVIQDLNDKEKILFGYGYAEAIPAMERIDRAGLDGTNIHVHNYFINILARGGIVHLFLYIFLYGLLLSKIINFKEGYLTAAFITAVLFVSFFDSSMETVRFPFLFFTVLSYKLSKE